MRMLLDNALGYANPANGIVDAASGYPAEGWNQEPRDGLFLRSFTQLTAIGTWIELLANVAAGYADTPYLSRDAALAGLDRAISSLLRDQRNPDLAAKGLLVNFLGFDGAERRGPLLESVEKRDFLAELGDAQGQAIWRALVEKGWLQEEDNGRKGRVRRGDRYGALHFDGALSPYSAEAVRTRIMGLLDRRAITIVFGDNANLTAALARSVGALLSPDIRDRPMAADLRNRMERFIEAQRDGYAHLFDPRTGTFVFGWDAGQDRFLGWGDGQGHWITGQMNYYINEFRGPLTFVVLRYGLPVAAIRNAGFKMKPYRFGDGSESYALAAWEGSAFQLLGLSLFMQELRNPAWRRSLEELVRIELDFSDRGSLPGLLSEAYSGKGTEYTGLIGIPELAVTDSPLNTHAPSLYTLGVAYSISPDRIEGFLERHWPTISTLFTDHGPWEGWDGAAGQPIRYQTTAHTLSLLLGGLGSAQENMDRYLRDKGLSGGLEDLYRPGARIDLMSPDYRIVPWAPDGTPLELTRSQGACRLAAGPTVAAGLAFVAPEDRALNLSNGRLRMRYRSDGEIPDASISFKRAAKDPLPPPSIPIEILVHLQQTQNGEIEVVLPATPALGGIAEISLTLGRGGSPRPLDVSIEAFESLPFDAALESPRP